MPFDYKKEFSEFYLPAKKPSIIKIPAMNFVAVSGKGNPNEEGGEYKKAMELLYGISFTIQVVKGHFVQALDSPLFRFFKIL